jgi:hypothetical protein
MKKKKHKFQVGQLIRVKNSFHVGEKLRKKYGFILQLSVINDEPEYKIIIQGEPEKTHYVYQKEIEMVE